MRDIFTIHTQLAYGYAWAGPRGPPRVRAAGQITATQTNYKEQKVK